MVSWCSEMRSVELPELTFRLVLRVGGLGIEHSIA